MKNHFTLEKGKHFTPTGLLSHLNKEFSKKLIANGGSYRGQQKTSFNLNDIHHYVLNEKLPDYLGGQKVREILIPFADLKIIEVNFR